MKNICPICGDRECVSHIEIWGMDIVEIRTLACNECLKPLKVKINKNKKIA